MRNLRVPARRLAISILLVLAAGERIRGARADEAPRVIPVVARRFEFVPARVSIAKGETVTLRVTSEDVTHGFFQRDLGIDADLAPGRPTEVTVTPKNVGTFTLICDHFCGAQHGGMKMTIVVE